MRLVTAAALAVSVYAAPATAQTPTKLQLNHFGRLLDSSDNPVTGTVTLTVLLYKSATSVLPADLVWSDEVSVEMKNGFYSLVLGDEQAQMEPLPASVFGDGTTPLWMTIKVGTQEMAPRLPLNLVPWANWANTAGVAQVADDLDCQPAGCVNTTDLADGAVTGVKLAASAVGVGQLAANLPGTVLAVGAVGASQIANDAVITTKIADASVTRAKLAGDGCNADQILVYSGTVWNCVALPQGALYTAAPSGGLTMPTTTSFAIASGGVTGTHIANDTISDSDLAAGSFPKITGVGTLTSNVSFDGTAARSISLGRATTGAGTSLTLTSGGAQSAGTDLAGGELRLSAGTATGVAGSVLTAYTAGTIGSGATGTTDRAPTEKLRITGVGHVGVNTTTPTARFQVKGAAAFTGSGTFSATATTTAVAGAPGTTKFASEIDVGDVIVAGGQTRVVATRTSDTAATVTEAWTAALTNSTFTIQKAPFQVDRSTNAMIIGTSATGDVTIGNLIRWGTTGVAPPAITTRSAGTKLVLYPQVSATDVDYALGIDGSTLWYSVPFASSTYVHRFTAGTTNLLRLRGDGYMFIGADDPGGGGGDQAYMHYYADGTGEDTRLEIRVSNDANDDVFIRGTGGTTTGTGDLAELYLGAPDLQLGDVVVMDPGRSGAVRKATGAYQSAVAGVTSARPFALLMSLNEAALKDPRYKPVTLAGRIPIKISIENGAVRAGDALTTSSKPGYAMKATEAGPILGYAFESFDGSVKSSEGVESMYADASVGCHDCEQVLRVFAKTPKAAPGTYPEGIMTVLVRPGYWAPQGTAVAQREEVERLRADVDKLRVENDALRARLGSVDELAERLRALETRLAEKERRLGGKLARR